MRINHQILRGVRLLGLVLAFALASAALAGDRVPGDVWMRYTDVGQAGFDAAKLEQARQAWEKIPSSAFLVIADGAVVASWGEVERRFMCHSVRKSFLSALYGIYWDQGKIELNKTMADLGIDDEPDPLLDIEKQARILDLIKARSGVFHPAAYAGRTDSQPRGSQGPGRYFAYNNWDFNTLVTIFEQETGARIFEAFDEHFGKPLGMQDWRISDGYYHYERDKSKHPAYPFRMSARDAARFGLLFARQGRWSDKQILSEHWVRRSSALYSIDNDIMGYGFMWWVLRQAPFSDHGMFAALGVGNQMIAALPKSDLVIVNRANTYDGQGTPTQELLSLVRQVLEARTGDPVAEPRLVPLETASDPLAVAASQDRLAEFAGEWDFPPLSLGLGSRGKVQISAAQGHLVGYTPTAGTFELYLQPDGWLHQEDTHRSFFPVRDSNGALTGVSDARSIVRAALSAAAAGEGRRASQLLSLVTAQDVDASVGHAIVDLLAGDAPAADKAIQELARSSSPSRAEAAVNAAGYVFLRAIGNAEQAVKVFELNTRAFPDSSNAWDSLGEAHMSAGNKEEALRCYERSLHLDPNNSNAKEKIQRMQKGSE